MSENLQKVEYERDETCELSREIGITVSLAKLLKDNIDSETKIADLWALADVLEERLKDIQIGVNESSM